MTTRPEPRLREIPERFARHYPPGGEAELHTWANDVFDALQEGKQAEQIVESSVKVGWDREFAQWLVHFTEAQQRPIRLLPLKAAATQALRENKNVALFNLWIAIGILVGYGINFSNLKSNAGSGGPLVAFLIRLIVYPLEVMSETITATSSEFTSGERFGASINLSFGVVFFLTAWYSITRLRAIALANRDAAASARFKQGPDKQTETP